ncbi:hypothetical protein T4A_7746 [Trichinella pseudospiralis]|uniref:Uncharacterized protein n=1 Tax=Trichinella pseudospiralis TaxID=6337 RepID=A0A0V1DZ35_TRIPS|nr:hypothetical protein T4A_7746 [Trichinella pseudospiralis]
MVSKFGVLRILIPWEVCPSIFHETGSRLTYMSSLSFSLIRNVYLTDEILLCIKEESVIAGGHSPGKYSKPYLHASPKVGRSV